MQQLQLPFVEQMDRQLAIDRKDAAKRSHEDWAASMLMSAMRTHPPRAEEWDVMLLGIRLDRFVSNLECEKCGLATKDHTAGFLFGYWNEPYHSESPVKMCLKDYYRVRKGG